MHEYAKQLIEKRIDSLIEEWDFEKRKKSHPEECPCYSLDKKCHDIEDLNCLFCLCPNYDIGVKEGKCNIESPNGKHIDNHEGKILDCSDCNLMHIKGNVKKYLLNRLYNI
jgi:Zn-finger protein